MKKIALSLCLLLTGCASRPVVVTTPVTAPVAGALSDIDGKAVAIESLLK
jgi:starvation-inducible outer membrane lipoprotein